MTITRTLKLDTNAGPVDCMLALHGELPENIGHQVDHAFMLSGLGVLMLPCKLHHLRDTGEIIDGPVDIADSATFEISGITGSYDISVKLNFQPEDPSKIRAYIKTIVTKCIADLTQLIATIALDDAIAAKPMRRTTMDIMTSTFGDDIFGILGGDGFGTPDLGGYTIVDITGTIVGDPSNAGDANNIGIAGLMGLPFDPANIGDTVMSPYGLLRHLGFDPAVSSSYDVIVGKRPGIFTKADIKV